VNAPLSVEGRKAGCLAATATELGCLILLLFGIFAIFAGNVTRDLGSSPFLSLLRMPVFWVIASLLALPGSFLLGWQIRRFIRARAGRVTFLEHAIAFTKPGAAFLVPWSHIAAYDDRSSAYVLLHRKGERISSADLGVPTLEERDREAVLELLSRRGIPGDGTRLPGTCEPGPASTPRLVLRPRFPPWVVHLGSMALVVALLIFGIALADRTSGLSCVIMTLAMPVLFVASSQKAFDVPSRAELHDDRLVLDSSWFARGRLHPRRVEMAYEDFDAFDASPRRHVTLTRRGKIPLNLPLSIPLRTDEEKEAVRAFLAEKGLVDRSR
jgi:hypothetical protein